MDDLLDSLRSELMSQTEEVLELAQLLVGAVQIDPRLLRNIRLEFLPLSDAGLEAAFWFSSLVATRSTDTITLDTNVAYVLGARLLRSNPTRFHQAHKFIRAQHQHLSPLVRLQEEWRVALIHGDDPRELLARLLKTMHGLQDADQRQALGRSLKADLAALPNRERAREEIQWLAGAAAFELGESPTRILGVAQAPAPPPRWLTPRDNRPLQHALGLRLSPGVLEITESTEADVEIRLADPPPIPILVTTAASPHTTQRWILARPGLRLALDPPDCRQVVLHLPNGRQIRAWAEETPESTASQHSENPTPNYRPKVLLNYIRGEREQHTIERLQDQLQGLGYEVLSDRSLSPGAEWRQTLRDWAFECDAAIALVSRTLLQEGPEARPTGLGVLCWRAAVDSQFLLIPAGLDGFPAAELHRISPVLADRHMIRLERDSDALIKTLQSHHSEHAGLTNALKGLGHRLETLLGSVPRDALGHALQPWDPSPTPFISLESTAFGVALTRKFMETPRQGVEIARQLIADLRSYLSRSHAQELLRFSLALAVDFAAASELMHKSTFAFAIDNETGDVRVIQRYLTHLNLFAGPAKLVDTLDRKGDLDSIFHAIAATLEIEFSSPEDIQRALSDATRVYLHLPPGGWDVGLLEKLREILPAVQVLADLGTEFSRANRFPDWMRPVRLSFDPETESLIARATDDARSLLESLPETVEPDRSGPGSDATTEAELKAAPSTWPKATMDGTLQGVEPPQSYPEASSEEASEA